MQSSSPDTVPREIYSNPRRELPTANAKYIKNCDELYLGERRITHVRGLEEFVNLEVLWLHDNNISSLHDELEENTRLKRLFLHGNNLRTITGLKLECLFLEKLTLFDNKITDLDACLTVLRRLRHLEELSLQGNPCAEEPNYRIRVLAALPSLHVFDRHVVTNLERRKASRLRKSLSAKAKNRKLNSGVGARSPGEADESDSIMGSIGGGVGNGLSGTERILYKELERVKREEEAKAKQDRAASVKAAMDALESQKELSGEKLRAALMPKGINFAQIEADKLAGVGDQAGALLAWDEYRLRKLFEKYDDDGSGELSLEEVRLVMAEMEDFGLRLKTPGKRLSPSDFDTLRDLRAAQAKRADEELRLLFEELDESGDGQVDITEFMKGLNGGVDWEMLPADVAEDKATKASKQSLHLQEKALLLPEGHADKMKLMREALDLSRKSERLLRVAALGREAEDEGTSKPQVQGFTAASKQDAEVVTAGKSRFAAQPKGKIIEIGEAPTKGRGDYISYYTARFAGNKKKKSASDGDSEGAGKTVASDEESKYASDSEDEEEFEERMLRETKYQKDHEQIGNVRKLARRASGSGGSGKNRGLSHSTSRVKLPSSIQDARALRRKFGLHAGDEDYALFKKDQESKASYEVCKYTEPM